MSTAAFAGDERGGHLACSHCDLSRRMALLLPAYSLPRNFALAVLDANVHDTTPRLFVSTSKSSALVSSRRAGQLLFEFALRSSEPHRGRSPPLPTLALAMSICQNCEQQRCPSKALHSAGPLLVLQPLHGVSDAAVLTFIPTAAGAPAKESSIHCESCTNAVNLVALPIQRRSAHQATESVGDALHVAQP